MDKIYEGFVTIHKSAVNFHGPWQQTKEFVKTLKKIQSSISYVKEWTMRYKGAPFDLVKKMKPQAELEKEKVWMLIQKNKQFTSFIGNIQDSYVWLFNSLDVLVRTHQIPSVGSLTKAKPKNQVWQEVEECLE